MVVVMTVNPGFGGQKFMPEQLPKIAEAKKCIEKIGTGIEIEVDGGINEENVGTVAKAGASIVVAGAAVFKGKRGPVEEIKALRKAAEKK
jgi:ribulose-phosphate 3-epimerase